MPNELKPCPFCGGEATHGAEVIFSKSGSRNPTGATVVYCSAMCWGKCRAHMSFEYVADKNVKSPTRTGGLTMPNDMRDRLIELLKIPIYPREDADPAEVVADYLLDSGVVLPPCKVGDTVYEINTTYPKAPYVNRYIVVAFHITSGKNVLGHKKPSHAVVGVDYMPSLTKRIYLENFGKTVFLTKEEAEKALKEREQK